MKIQDPRTILQTDLPLFVFSDSATDLIAFLITWRTKGTWNHAMLAVYQGMFTSQGWTYQSFPMDGYMKKGFRLDFYKLVNMTPKAAAAALEYTTTRLKKPWWTKMYDWVGIFGQAIGLPKVHTPGLEYCSVDVTNCLKSIAFLLPTRDCKIILRIPDEVTPQELHDYMVANPEVFCEYGNYEADEGVII